MKALTLHQPWATLIGLGVKSIETRSWAAPKSLIGQRIAIHAAKRPWSSGQVGDYMLNKFAMWLQPPHSLPDGYVRSPVVAPAIPMPLGAMVCTAVLVDCVPIDRWSTASHTIGDYPHEGPLPHQQGGLWLIGSGEPNNGTPTRVETQRPYGDFRPGRWAWLLTDVEAFDEPVPVKGRQGLWNWDGVDREGSGE